MGIRDLSPRTRAPPTSCYRLSTFREKANPEEITHRQCTSHMPMLPCMLPRGNILTTELLPPSIGTHGPLNRDRLPDTRPRKRTPADVVMCAPTHGGTTSDTAQGGFTMTFADTGCMASCARHPGLLEPHPLFPWGARPPEIPMPPSVCPLRSPRRGRGGVQDSSWGSIAQVLFKCLLSRFL